MAKMGGGGGAGNSSAVDSGEEEGEEEVGPALPAGFVPDTSVQVGDEDAGFDEGEVCCYTLSKIKVGK